MQVVNSVLDSSSHFVGKLSHAPVAHQTIAAQKTDASTRRWLQTATALSERRRNPARAFIRK
ncbi:hypothetical protein GCM10010520_11730 [Rhizobium viscosum]